MAICFKAVFPQLQVMLRQYPSVFLAISIEPTYTVHLAEVRDDRHHVIASRISAISNTSELIRTTFYFHHIVFYGEVDVVV